MTIDMAGIVGDSIVDGPGIRTVYFSQGCPHRCEGCQNPETWEFGAGTPTETETLANVAKSNPLCRGVTFSGGEPLSQADFLLEVLDLTKSALPSIIDTSCHGDYRKLKALAEKAESLHVGLKVLDDEKARQWTGQGSSLILENIRRLDKECATPYCFRLPLIPNVTDSEENLTAIAHLARELNNLTSVDFLPYNPVTGGKYAACGRAFDPGFDENAPTLLDLETFRKLCPVEARVLK